MSFFPATESTLSAVHLNIIIRARYAFSPHCVTRLLRTGMNHLYKITDGERHFVFRIYTHGWRSDEEVAEEVRLLLHLQSNDVPVSYPVTDVDGGYIQRFDAIEGARVGVMYSFAPGRKVPLFSPEYAYNAGVAMGNMHRVTQNMELARTVYGYNTLVERPREAVISFFGEKNEEVQFLIRAGEYSKQHIFPRMAAMRRGVIHLDIWFDNMHFDEEGRVTLFDFDFCGVGVQSIDIGYFLYQLFSTNHATGGYAEKSAAFLEGYTKYCPLPGDERSNAGALSLPVLLYYIGVQCQKFDTWSNIFLNEEHLKRYVASLKRWLAFNEIEF